MKSIFTGLGLTLLFMHMAAAQPGHIALGARIAPDGAGINVKSFVDRRFGIEMQLNFGGFRYFEGHSYSAVGMIEYHLPLPSPEFSIFFGGGLHFGYWTGRKEGGHPNEFVLGLDGIGGIEYLFQKFPIGISGDLKPALNYMQEVEFFPHCVFGFSGRYYFGGNRVKPGRVPR